MKTRFLSLLTALALLSSCGSDGVSNTDAGAPNAPAKLDAGKGEAAATSVGSDAATGSDASAATDLPASATGGSDGVIAAGGSTGTDAAMTGTGGNSDAAGGATGSGGGGGAGTMTAPVAPLAAGLGTPCMSNADCPAGVTCMNPSSATVRGDCMPGMFCTGITVTRAALGWSGGYCAPTCAKSADCGATSTYGGSCLFGGTGSTLTIIGGEAPTKCVLSCGPKNECPAGLVCSGGITCGDPAGSTLKFCLPCGASTGAGKAAAAR